MKHCPACQQLFTDEGLKFCRLDGTPLLSMNANFYEARTMLFAVGSIADRFPWVVPPTPLADKTTRRLV